jgi:Protein of unknown function (DUF1559)
MNLGLAMNNFARDRGRNRFPAAAIRKDGKPLLSWRVALLPFLDEQGLYDKFHLDEPWDSPHNKPLLDQMPDIYAPVTRKEDESRHSTYYQVFTGPGALFGGDDGTSLAEIKDGANLTIMIVEEARPVPWTKPEDLPFDKEKPLPELGGLFKDGFHALTAGGSARFLRRSLNPEVLHALITHHGGESRLLNFLEQNPLAGIIALGKYPDTPESSTVSSTTLLSVLPALPHKRVGLSNRPTHPPPEPRGSLTPAESG